MSTPAGALRRALTHHLLSGDLPGPLARWTHRRIGQNAQWRAAYNEMRAAEKAATAEDAFTESQLGLLEGAVLASVAAPSSTRARWAVGLVAASLTAALLVVVAPTLRSSGTDELVARSAGAPTVGLRVRCLEEGSHDVRSDAVLSVARPGASLRCPAASVLAFSVTNLSPEDAHVLLVGVRRDGEPLWFAPFSEGGRSLPVGRGVVDEIVDVVATTGGMELGQRVTLFALFDDAPIDAGAVAREMRGASSRGLALHAVDRLPVGVAAQSRADLIIEGGPSR